MSERVQCPSCTREVLTNGNGEIRKHRKGDRNGATCHASGTTARALSGGWELVGMHYIRHTPSGTFRIFPEGDVYRVSYESGSDDEEINLTYSAASLSEARDLTTNHNPKE